MLSARKCQNCWFFLPCFVHLHRFELQPFRIGVDRIHDAATSRHEGPNIEMMSGGDRESDQIIVIKDRDTESNVGSVGGTVVRRVVHDHVAGAKLLRRVRQTHA